MSLDTLREIIHDCWPPAPRLLPKDYPDLTGKYALITGCSAGIGYESARLLLSKNATVVMVNRNRKKTEAAIKRMEHTLIQDDPSLTSEILSERILNFYLDLSDLTTIKSGISGIEKAVPRLDIVILNAGVMFPPTGSLSKQGYELQFGTNVVGHHLLLKFLHPLIVLAPSPRVIHLSSLAHRGSPTGGLTWDFKAGDATFTKKLTAYAQSKTGTLYQAYHYGKLFKDKGVISLPVHPGLLQSELQRDLPYFMTLLSNSTVFKPTVYGAYTELFAALHPDISLADSGRYIGPWGEFRPVRKDILEGCTDGTAEKLWKYLDDEVKEYL